MAGFIDIFKSIVTGDPLQGIRDLIGEFHLSPEDKAKLQTAASELDLRRDQIIADREKALADIQGQNIRAEATSEDPWVRRARPSFLWVMIAAIGMSLIVFPIVNAVMGKGIIFPEIPGAYLELFGVGYLGYTGARTWEKLKSK